MSNLYDKDEGYVSEEDVEDSVNDEEEDDDVETEQDESFLQSLTQEVIESNIDIVNRYVPDPNTPDEFNQNEITKQKGLWWRRYARDFWSLTKVNYNGQRIQSFCQW